MTDGRRIHDDVARDISGAVMAILIDAGFATGWPHCWTKRGLAAWRAVGTTQGWSAFLRRAIKATLLRGEGHVAERTPMPDRGAKQ